MELHLETDAQVKALPPNTVDNHIRDRVARLECQLKAAYALVHFGDIVLQAGVLAALGSRTAFCSNSMSATRRFWQ